MVFPLRWHFRHNELLRTIADYSSSFSGRSSTGISTPGPEDALKPDAASGFCELGEVWKEVGKKKKDSALEGWGKQLLQESAALDKDVQQGISRSILRNENPPYLPAIAGVRVPFHIAVAQDKLDPLHRSYRAIWRCFIAAS